MTDQGNGFFQKWDALDDLCSNVGMFFHNLPLFLVQRAGFVEDIVAYADLADVVQNGAALQYL